MTPEETKSLEALRTPCEIYSRVVGYIRPVNQWNDGKQAEYGDRVMFNVEANNC
jgi:ribonucleoside-triphosphate reductase